MIKKVYVCNHCSEEMDKPYKTLRVQDFTSDEWHYCEKCWKNVLTYLNEGGNLLLFWKSDVESAWTRAHIDARQI